ncbi:hypothetical protein Salat_0801000 [Sesamum alatum]|uniref:DUF7610 domain-containing protein n=1 Tax=Sesamum alatum TaxID=300844 RepID=A0AAE1YUM1_9LAMI|nr:hypothetical protein Salat_0801000 [Sesamum alatum]
MTRRSVILQKKLHQLESKLADVFRRPLDKHPDPGYQFVVDDIEQRFIFLNHLLRAEASSRPQNADYLHEIGEKLHGLEAAFRGWDEYRTCTQNNYLDGDTPSVCSDCTQTLLNDDAVRVCDSDGEKSPEKCVDDENAKEGEGLGRIWGKIAKYFGAFGSGAIVGAICVINFYSSSDFNGYEFCFRPPT